MVSVCWVVPLFESDPKDPTDSVSYKDLITSFEDLLDAGCSDLRPVTKLQSEKFEIFHKLLRDYVEEKMACKNLKLSEETREQFLEREKENRAGRSTDDFQTIVMDDLLSKED